MIGVYIHIPFCRTLCPYCDFVRRAIPGAVPDVFVDGLCREIEEFVGPSDVCSVFFGGGTPSLMSPVGLSRVMAAVGRRFELWGDVETTVEVNPDDVTPDLVMAWRDGGVNRVSLGVQSFDDCALCYLGRRHDADTARRACGMVAESFENWGMDLIFGVPPLDGWGATLEECVRFFPAHVSTYGLTYEVGTPFEERQGDAVDDGTWLALYQRAEEVLVGYDHYEISNFARSGRQCRHNLIYWHNEEYVGFGPGAYSFINGVRSRNVVDVDRWLVEPGCKEEVLSLTVGEIRLETVIQYLRLRVGLPFDVYAQRFGRSFDVDYGGALRQLVARGLVEVLDSGVRPTREGFALNNEIGLMLME